MFNLECFLHLYIAVAWYHPSETCDWGQCLGASGSPEALGRAGDTHGLASLAGASSAGRGQTGTCNIARSGLQEGSYRRADSTLASLEGDRSRSLA